MKRAYSKAVLRRLASALALGVLLSVPGAVVFSSQPVNAQVSACGAAATSTYGTATQELSSVAAGTYQIWTRVKAAGTATYDLKIDGAGGSSCAVQVSKASNGAWVWYKHSTALNWSTTSNMRVQMIGDAAGVGVDCVVLRADTVDLTNSGLNGCSATYTPPVTGDTTPPSTPGSFTAAAQSSSSVQLTWVLSTDNVGVTRYELTRQTGTQTAVTVSSNISATTTSYTDSSLSPSTAYTYRLTAVDAAGNRSVAATASATTQAGTVATVLTLPKTLTVPTIDANEDDVWTKVTASSIARTIVGSSVPATDLSGSFRSMWDANNLYFHIAVSDDVRSTGGGNAWNTDSVEVYIDGDASAGQSYTGDANVGQYTVLRGGTTVVKGGSTTVQATVVQKEVAGGYVLELRMPWSTIGSTPGTRIGLDVHINDDDNNDATRDNKVSWYGTADTAWTNPSTFAPVALGTNTVSGTVNSCSKYDVNASGTVNITDANIVFSNRNTTDPALITKYDMNASNSVNITDANIVFNNRNCTL